MCFKWCVSVFDPGVIDKAFEWVGGACVVVCWIKGWRLPARSLISPQLWKLPFNSRPTAQLHNCTPSSHHPREHLRPTERQRRHEMGSSWIVNPFGGRCIVESCLAKVTFHGYKFSRIIVFQRCELVKPLKAKLSIIWFVAVQVISLLVPTFSKVLQGQPYSQQKSHATILEYLSLYIS